MFYKINDLNNFAKFTGKHLCWSLVFRPSPVTGSSYAGKLKNPSLQYYICNNTAKIFERYVDINDIAFK